MIEKFQPDFIINTGIAGGLDERLEVLSIVIGDKLTYHDFNHILLNKYFPYTAYFHSDKKAVRLTEAIVKKRV